MVGRISIWNSREFMAIVLSVRAAPREIQKQIRQQTKTVASEEWRAAMAEQNSLTAGFRMQDRVLVNTARVTVSNQNIRLSSATVGRTLTGGLNPKKDYASAEFGADRKKRTTYTATSRKGNRYVVRQRRTTQQLPPRNRKGWVFYPAASTMVPRMFALWAQTTVRERAEAFEGKSS